MPFVCHPRCPRPVPIVVTWIVQRPVAGVLLTEGPAVAVADGGGLGERPAAAASGADEGGHFHPTPTPESHSLPLQARE
jgi:hypothetical protein